MQDIRHSSATPTNEATTPELSRGDRAILRWTSESSHRILHEIFQGFSQANLEVSIRPLSISSAYLIDSGRPGTARRISAGIHGNELCGPEAVAKLLTEFVSGTRTLASGSLTVVIANEAAVRENKRYCAVNMNRIFGIPDGNGGHEGERARTLQPLYDGSHAELRKFKGQPQAVLDLHSTSLSTPPFVWAERFHDRLMPRLGIPNALLHARSSIPQEYLNTVQGYCTGQHILCFTVECGQHTADETFKNAEFAIERFLAFTGEAHETPNPIPVQRIGIYAGDQKNTEGFRFKREFQSFEYLPLGFIIGEDPQRQFKMPFDGYIIFPCPPERAKVGKEEVYMLAQKYDPGVIERINKVVS